MRISVGIDAAKEEHWATAVTADGQVVLNRMVTNTGEDIQAFTAELAALGVERAIGIDMLGGIATLVTAMLIAAGERVVHVPGLAVNRAARAPSAARPRATPKTLASSPISSGCATISARSRWATMMQPSCACWSPGATISWPIRPAA